MSIYLLVTTLLLPLFVACHYPFAFPPRWGDPFSALGPWGRHHPPCGIPPFLHRLPEEMQKKVQAIWAGYKEGDDCEEEHQKTRQIIHSLPDDVRWSIKSDRCGPSFLRNVSKAVRDEFKKVWFDHRLTLDLKELTLKKLAYSLLTGSNLERFNKWDQRLQARKAEYAARYESLSSGAKEAMENWKAIRLQERAFLTSLPKTIREELKSVYCMPHCEFLPSPTEASSSTATPTTAEPSSPSTTDVTTSSGGGESLPAEKYPFFFDLQFPELPSPDSFHCFDGN